MAFVHLPWAAAAQSPAPEMVAHTGPVRALAMLPDGRMASAGFDSAIIVWDLALGKAMRIVRQHATAVSALVARPDGCLVSGGEDADIKVWCDTDTAAPLTLTGHGGAVSSLAVSSDGQTLASGSWDRTVRVWDAQGQSRVVAEHAAPVTSVVVSPDGATVASASQDGTVRLTSVASGAPAGVMKLGVPIAAMVRTPGGALVLACADGVVREIDAQFALVRDVAKLDGAQAAIALSPNGKTVALGGIRSPVTLIDLADGTPAVLNNSAGLPVWTLVFARDGREMIIGGSDRALRRFDVLTGNPITPAIATTTAPDIADPKDRGAVVFRSCRACHGLTAADTNLAGPTLHQIMGRRIASLPGYAFSKPLAGMDIVWTPETIAQLFERGPAQFTPGTKMPEQRITDPADRQALVEWLARVTAP